MACLLHLPWCWLKTLSLKTSDQYKSLNKPYVTGILGPSQEQQASFTTEVISPVLRALFFNSCMTKDIGFDIKCVIFFYLLRRMSATVINRCRFARIERITRFHFWRKRESWEEVYKKDSRKGCLVEIYVEEGGHKMLCTKQCAHFPYTPLTHWAYNQVTIS